MAYVQTRLVTAGEMITGTFDQLALLKREIAIYCGAFLAAGLLVDVFEPLRSIMGFATFFGYFAAQYWLYREALSKAGVMVDPRFKVFGFFGMAMILILPIMFGFNFLVIPGLLLAAKWVMAPAFHVAEERDLFSAMGASWRASENNLLALFIAFSTLCVIWMVAVGILGAATSALTGTLGDFGGGTRNAANAFEWLGFHLLPIMLMGLSVAAYRALADEDTSLVAVFE